MSRFARFRWYHGLLIFPVIALVLSIVLLEPVDRLLAELDRRALVRFYAVVEKALPRGDPELESVHIVGTRAGTEVRAFLSPAGAAVQSRQALHALRSLAEGSFLKWKAVRDDKQKTVYSTDHQFRTGPSNSNHIVYLVDVGVALLSFVLLGFAMSGLGEAEARGWRKLARRAAAVFGLILLALWYLQFYMMMHYHRRPMLCSRTEKNYVVAESELRATRIALPGSRSQNANNIVCERLVGELVETSRQSGRKEYFYRIAPYYDDFYLYMGTVLIQCAPTEAEPLRVRVAYDLSFEPACGYDGLVEQYITPE